MTPTELREARKGLGLTQKAMAERLLTPYRTYQDWENGVARIPRVVDLAIEYLNEARRQMVAAKRKEKVIIRNSRRLNMKPHICPKCNSVMQEEAQTYFCYVCMDFVDNLLKREG